MKKHFAVVFLLAFLAACGGGSSSPSSPTPPAPVTPVNATGQWEIIGQSSSGSGKAVVIETNLAKNSAETVFANSSNTVVIVGTASGESVITLTGLGLFCDQDSLGGFDSLDATFAAGSATQASFTASDAGPSGSTQVTGTVNFNSQGTSIASGQYSAPAACGFPADSGTVTGMKIQPFSGSYAGMFNSGANSVIVTVTENASTYSFTVSGTDNGAPLSLTGLAIGGAFTATGTDNGVATSFVGVYDPVGNDFLVYTNASPPSFMGQLHAGTNPASVAKPGMFAATKR